MCDEHLQVRNKDKIDLYFIQIGDEPKKAGFPLSIEARARGLNTLASFGTPSMKVQLKKANKLGAQFVAIIGIMEARQGICQLKDMRNGDQQPVKLEDLLDVVCEKVGKENLDFYTPEKELIVVEPVEEPEDPRKKSQNNTK